MKEDNERLRNKTNKIFNQMEVHKYIALLE